MRVAECLKFLALLSKVPQNLSAFFLGASLMKQLVNFLHSDRASFQLSVVHGAPGTSVQFISYFEISRLIGESERSLLLSHTRGHDRELSIYVRPIHIATHPKNMLHNWGEPHLVRCCCEPERAPPSAGYMAEVHVAMYVCNRSFTRYR